MPRNNKMTKFGNSSAVLPVSWRAPVLTDLCVGGGCRLVGLLLLLDLLQLLFLHEGQLLLVLLVLLFGEHWGQRGRAAGTGQTQWSKPRLGQHFFFFFLLRGSLVKTFTCQAFSWGSCPEPEPQGPRAKANMQMSCLKDDTFRIWSYLKRVHSIFLNLSNFMPNMTRIWCFAHKFYSSQGGHASEAVFRSLKRTLKFFTETQTQKYFGTGRFLKPGKLFHLLNCRERKSGISL